MRVALKPVVEFVIHGSHADAMATAPPARASKAAIGLPPAAAAEAAVGAGYCGAL